MVIFAYTYAGACEDWNDGAPRRFWGHGGVQEGISEAEKVRTREEPTSDESEPIANLPRRRHQPMGPLPEAQGEGEEGGAVGRRSLC